MIHQGRTSLRYFWVCLLGVLLVALAGLVSSGTIERALLSNPERTLSWGPALFRLLLATHGVGLILAGVFCASRTQANKDSGPQASIEIESGLETSWRSWTILTLLSVVALALRLWHLDSDLWHDEVGTLLNFVRPPIGEIVTSFPNQNQHMLYSVLAHASVGIFGESAWAIRLPAVLFGVGSVWALFLLGRRLIGTRQALLACALMTFSYHHVWFSQNARGYTGLLLFVLLATWLWLESLWREGWGWRASYALSVVLGLMIHMTMAFVVAAHALLFLILWVRQTVSQKGGPSIPEIRTGWKAPITWLLAGTVTLQLYALALPEFVSKALHEVSLPSEWTNALWVVAESLRNLRFGLSGTAVVLVGGAIVLIGWLSFLRRNFRAGVLMVLPAALAGATMLAMSHNLWPRFFFFSMGFGLLIVVHGAMTAPRVLVDVIRVVRVSPRLTEAVGTAVTLLIITASAFTVPRNYSLPKQDFTGARTFVELNRQPGDAVVSVGLAGMDYGHYAPHWSVAKTESELETIRRGQKSTWLIYTLPIHVKAWLPEIWNTIETDFEVVRVFRGTLSDGDVYVCRQKPMARVSNDSSGVPGQKETHTF